MVCFECLWFVNVLSNCGIWIIHSTGVLLEMMGRDANILKYGVVISTLLKYDVDEVYVLGSGS
jgi:hypothetical protein